MTYGKLLWSYKLLIGMGELMNYECFKFLKMSVIFFFAVILHKMTLNRNSTKVLFVLDRCLVTLSLELKSSTYVYTE